MSNEVVSNDFTLEVSKVKSLKGRVTKNGNIQISIFKKFEIQPKTNQTPQEAQPTGDNSINDSSIIKYKKIEDVILDKAKAKELSNFLTQFLA